MQRMLAALIGLPLVALTAPVAVAQDPDADAWLRECRERRSRAERHCEIREYRLALGSAPLRVDAGPNGSIRISAWDRPTVRVVAKVQAQAPSAEEAREIVNDVRVELGDRAVRSSGPRLSGRRSWAVSFDIVTPARTGAVLSTTNGAVSVEDLVGDLDLETTNGSIHVTAVTGTVRAETTNGEVVIELGRAPTLNGDVEAETTNGNIRLVLPGGVNADLDASTTNGGIEVDFPVTVQGRIGRRLSGTLGTGGPLIRLRTTNGGIAIRKA
jgi:hypothetical protein